MRSFPHYLQRLSPDCSRIALRLACRPDCYTSAIILLGPSFPAACSFFLAPMAPPVFYKLFFLLRLLDCLKARLVLAESFPFLPVREVVVTPPVFLSCLSPFFFVVERRWFPSPHSINKPGRLSASLSFSSIIEAVFSVFVVPLLGLLRTLD